ncbi:MAG: hypothetical protein WCD53_11580 [Microcoleus sp.]
MSNANLGKLGCRHCRHYQQQGRRGGQCHLLGVGVRGDWKACPLVLHPFAPSWENLDDGRIGLPQISKQPHIAQAMPPPGKNFQSQSWTHSDSSKPGLMDEKTHCSPEIR